MHLKKGIHQEVIEAKENRETSDRIIDNVDTFPLKPGGANFKTNRLSISDKTRAIYKPTIWAVLFCIIFIAVGIGVPIFTLLNKDNAPFVWITLIAGPIFLAVGCYILVVITKPRVFDKKRGYYYRSFKNDINNITNKTKLDKIVALQIIGEVISDDDGSYNSFELNLVLKNSERINVVDHGNLRAIIKDAQYLSDFLNVPIWHATSHSIIDL